ncbi:MAG TPA: nuclear transport factor 2 family protein [Phycisphaerae bacterium]|nr:nuclear transport factor 2 family protein [Phycisphaerae bacterium]HPS52653.1 nuclear transport factor 2 family protein [Phycisphaerae bacterium]
MKELFCEDPTYLYIAVTILELLLLFIYFKTRSVRFAMSLLIPVAICWITFALDYFIVTDREQITLITREIASAVVKDDFKPAEKYLDDNYNGYGGDRSQIIRLAEGVIKKIQIKSCRLTDFNIRIVGRHANMTVVSTLRTDGAMGDGVYCLRWTVYWVKTNADWRIRSVEEPRQTLPGFGK